MIGAMVLRLTWKRTVEKEFARRDLEHMVGGWDEDGLLEFGGTHAMSGAFQGREQIRSWFTQWLDRMERIDFKVTKVGIGRPWALGLTNTVFYEAKVTEVAHDGTRAVVDISVVTQVRRGKLLHQRVYLFDETADLLMWGRRSETAAA